MANKRDNEAVVNRFLFSTLYMVLMVFYIYYTYAAGVSPRYFSSYIIVFNITMIVLAIATVAVGIAHFGFKKASKYHFFVLLVAFVIVAFLRLSMLIPIAIPQLSLFGNVKNRHIAAAIITLIVYLYELVRYFIKNK